jgi:uncharacterized membrane protein YfcA
MNIQIITFILIGITAGITSGFFGIGGGLIIIPSLIYIAGFSQHLATGTSLAVLLPPIGIAAFLVYYRNNNVNVPAAIIIALSLIVSSWFSARFANNLNPMHLRLAFGIFISVIGLYITLSTLFKILK